MARIFTTQFQFNHQTYDAIVTVISTNGKLSFNVKVLDMELFDLLPGGHVRYEGHNGFRQIDLDNRLSQSLLQSIGSSIEEHLIEKP
jgi:hypothetical protein